MAIWHRLVAAIFSLAFSAGLAVAQTDQRVALVIGNGNYLSVVKLKNPANDAKAIAAKLRNLGFDVIEREDVSRREMIQATRGFAEKLAPGGIGLLFYAGHGIQAQGANYLVPVDAALAVEDDLKYETIDLQDILSKLDDARVRLSIVILDACRDNPFRSFRSSTGGLAMINPPVGTVIAYATAPGKVAGDGEGDHSVFTAELLKAIGKPYKLLDVFEHVTDAVERQTGNAQTPWINSSFRGDFYFTGPTTVTITPPPEPAAGATSSEIVFWQSIAASTNPADFEAYLTQFPLGSFAALARIRLASLSARQAPAQPPPSADSRPPEGKSPKSASAPGTKQKPVTADPPDSQRASPLRDQGAPDAATNSPTFHARPPEQPETPPAVVANAEPPPPRKLVPPPAATATPRSGSKPLGQGSAEQPTLQAMVRPPPVITIQPSPPDATQPSPTVPAPPPEPARPARFCRIPYFTGMDTGAGGYAAIGVVNTGDRCGGHLYYRRGVPFDSLSVSKPPSHGSVAIEGSAFYYTPAPGFVGQDEFAVVSTPWGHFRAVVTVLPPGPQR